mgnify:CR=1 FL=1
MIIRYKKNTLKNEKEVNTNSKETSSKLLNTLLDLGFFMYLSAYLGNKQGTGTIDAIILRASFAFYVSVFLFKWLINSKENSYKKNDSESKNYFYFGIFFWFAIFTAYGFLSYFWALNGERVFYNINSFVSILTLCIILPYSIKNRTDLNKYLQIFVFSNIYSIFQLLIKVPIKDWQDEGRLGLAIGWHPNDFGIHLACACLVSLYLATISYSKKKYLNYLLFFTFVVVMLFSGSRQATLMFVLGLFIYAVFSAKNNLKRIEYIVAVFMIILFFYWLFLSNDTLYTLIGSRFEGLYNFFIGEKSKADGSAYERVFYLEQAKQLFYQKPIQGFGMANFAQYMTDIGYSHNVWCHNNYLELLSGIGIIGCGIFYGFLTYLTIKLIKPSIVKDKLAILLLSLIVMYYFDDIVAVNYYYIYNHVIYIFAYCYLKCCVSPKCSINSMKEVLK